MTLGKFDGLHRGHQKLVERVREYAKTEGVRSIVCAFDMLPLRERMHMPGKVLMTKEERADHLEGKVDFLVDCPFTERIFTLVMGRREMCVCWKNTRKNTDITWK